MTGMALIDPGDEVLIEVDWNDFLPSGIGLAGDVVHAVPLPLVKISEVTDTIQALSQVKVRGAQHGALYMIEAQATLTNTEIVNRQFPVRCFNG
jgi:hypothetical protein